MSTTSPVRPALFVSHSSADAGWAEEVHRLLDTHGYGAFLDSHPDDGIQVGEEWEQTLWTRLRQSSGVVVLCSRDWLRSPWCLAEALVAHERGKTIFVLVDPDVPDSRSRRLPGAGDEPSVPGFLRDVQFLRLAGRSRQEVEDRLLAGIDSSLVPDRAAVREPYRGLEPYEEDDAGVFFGRDPEEDQLIRVLNQRRRGNAHGFVLVLGASGTGKSSLVRAGVLPRLRRADGGATWLVAPPVQAGEGLEGLARSLARLGDPQAGADGLQSVRGRLAGCLAGPEVDPGPLLEVASEALVTRGRLDAYVVVLVDQLEEVFRDPGGSSRRALALVLAACAQPGSRLVAVATMRSDYLNSFQLLPAVSAGYEEMTLDPMPRERFTEVVTGPAEVVGLRLEPGLAERLVADTGHEDALPLLAYALRELYVSYGAADGDLTVAEYEQKFPPVDVRAPDGGTAQVKGVPAAVKAVADRILVEEGYRQLADDHPRVRDLRSAALRLADYSEGEPVRATARWSAMPASCERVLRRLESQRLLVSGVDSTGEATVSVAHEALFRVWDRFQRWLADSQDVLAVRGQVRRAAAEWAGAGRAADLVWTDERVVAAVQEMCRGGIACPDPGLGATHPLSETEREFLGPLSVDEVMTSLESADLTLPARGRLGVRLALLGDTRPGIWLDDAGLPDLAWDTVEQGTVELRDPTPQEWAPLAEELSRLTGGSIPDPASSTPRRHLDDERPQPVASFAMSRYLVTWGQLRAFRAATDYADGQWWDRRAGQQNAPPPDRPGVPGNHPATHLTWYEARAFCRWLTAHLGSDPPVRLPTEHEWQLAATGGDPDRLYPWGSELDEPPFAYANTFEGRIQAHSHLTPTTTAVGVFPLGRSPDGLMDMSGNAWEWCDSAFHRTQDTGTDDGPRVVRGGSWVIGMPACTTVYCGQLDPAASRYFVGFRPVRSLPRPSDPASIAGLATDQQP